MAPLTPTPSSTRGEGSTQPDALNTYRVGDLLRTIAGRNRRNAMKKVLILTTAVLVLAGPALAAPTE
ncbi:MAG: hypothetical protein NTU94_02600, partial [Planctomycetota bacterium]|nr:hypothetical protein [Planctomycetota bacterium]